MSLKSLFGRDEKPTKIISLANFDSKLDDVESIGYIEQFIKDANKYRTHTDFLTASNFAVYGSLEEYYRAGIDRIINTYPYDGSLKERLTWFNESNGFDVHLFENEYPRTNGYIQLGSTWANFGPTWANLDPAWAQLGPNSDPTWAQRGFEITPKTFCRTMLGQRPFRR